MQGGREVRGYSHVHMYMHLCDNPIVDVRVCSCALLFSVGDGGLQVSRVLLLLRHSSATSRQQLDSAHSLQNSVLHVHVQICTCSIVHTHKKTL